MCGRGANEELFVDRSLARIIQLIAENIQFVGMYIEREYSCAGYFSMERSPMFRSMNLDATNPELQAPLTHRLEELLTHKFCIKFFCLRGNEAELVRASEFR